MKITECIIKEYESLAEFFNRFMDHAEENNLEELTVDDYFDAANCQMITEMTSLLHLY